MWFLNKSRVDVWQLLALALKGCVVVLFGVWIFLLSNICSSPRLPVTATGNTISYNCHGTVVFITVVQYVLLMFLIPLAILVGFCGKVAARKAERTSKGGNSESA